jgi:isoleucyl-tRNA synthetase
MRHGEADNNVDNGVRKYKDLEENAKLTEKGKEQVLESSKGFKEKIDVVISSPYDRAKETAKIICGQIGFPSEKIIIDERIHEWEISSFFEGKERDLFSKYYDSEYLDNPFEALPDGESFVQVVKRVGDFIYDIEKKYSGKNILIVGHQGATCALSFLTEGFMFGDLSSTNNPLVSLQNAEIREFDFTPLPHNKDYELDLHRPYIDEVNLVCECGDDLARIPEVLDCWFESGSMPFAQDHYPFENKNWQKNNFPAGFVAEYIAQTRTWFYYTHVVSTILFDHAPFKNVVTTGTLRAEDGEKMSKSKNNYPDPWSFIDKYGADALRIYLMSSTLMKGEDANFSEKAVQDISSKIIGRLFNVLAFYELYREKELEIKDVSGSDDVLDQWILARFYKTLEEITEGMEGYDMAEATRPLDLFIDDLSTWYLRRSRDRIKDGDKEAKQTLYYILKTLAKVIAPFAPFAAEDIWLKLRNDPAKDGARKDVESVHLTEWPTKPFELFSFGKSKVLQNMEMTRNIVTLGLEARQKAGIKVRQPLGRLEIKNFALGEEYTELIKDEINVKEVVEDKNIENEVVLDTEITEELKQEGDYRELVRAVQDMRKKMGLTPSDVVMLTVETNDAGKKLIQKFEPDMKKTVLVSEMDFKNTDGEEIKIGELVFKIKIEK